MEGLAGREVDECGCSWDFHQKGVYIEPETGSTLIRCLCCFSFFGPLRSFSLCSEKGLSLSRFFYLLRLSSVEKRGALVCIIRSVAIDTNCPYREERRTEKKKKKRKIRWPQGWGLYRYFAPAVASLYVCSIYAVDIYVPHILYMYKRILLVPAYDQQSINVA